MDEGHHEREILPFCGCGDTTPSAFSCFAIRWRLFPPAYISKILCTIVAWSCRSSRRTPVIMGLPCWSKCDVSSMAKKTRRGVEGRALTGFHTGGRRFGYRNWGGPKRVSSLSSQVVESARSELLPSEGPQTTGFEPPDLHASCQRV